MKIRMEERMAQISDNDKEHKKEQSESRKFIVQVLLQTKYAMNNT